MATSLTRRTALTALGTTPILLAQGSAPASISSSVPYQDPALVREMVGVAHRDVNRVRELVESHPALSNAAVDQGFGDWEDALGAAAHTGRRPIAEVLLAHGARMSIFAAAMLGHLDVVKAIVSATPGIQRTHGPHGITLLAHARAGGKDAEPVVRYLETVGDADVPVPTQPLKTRDRDTLVGRYVFGPGANDAFEANVKSDRFVIARSGGSDIRLNHRGNLVFSPAGAHAVKIAFAANQLTIADPEVFLVAKRER